MISRDNAVRIFISVNIVSWLLLLVVNLLNFFGWNNYPALGVPVYLKGRLLNIFLAFIFFCLGRCLEKNQFITASFFLIDTHIHAVRYARAGHYPTLYFSVQENNAFYLQDKGLGLGYFT